MTQKVNRQVGKKEITKTNEKVKKYKTIIIIAVAICVVLIITIICLVILIGKDKNGSNNGSTSNDIKVSVKGSTIEELKTNSKSDIDNLTKSLEDEWKKISGEIKTFDSYKENKDKVSNFYDRIVKNSEDFSIRAREYALKYVEIIIHSEKSFYDKYDELETIYDDIYDGIAEDLYKDIYDGLLEDMYDYYYDGILDDAYDKVPYSDYSNMRSTEYKNYSNARSDVYKAYSKVRSDVYQFYSKIRSKIYSKNLDKAEEAIQDFSKDIEKLKNKYKK